MSNTTSTQQPLELNQENTIKVLAIPDDDYDASIENEFEDNFGIYGQTKIIIDSRTALSSTITADLLSESQADVLYLHNIHQRTLSVDEQNVILSYVSNGHGIIGTHGTLNPNHAPLAALFGINPDMISNGGMNTFPISTTMNLDDTSHPLLANISEPYDIDRTMTAALNGQESPWFKDPRILLENGNLLSTSPDGNVAIIYSEAVNTGSVYLTHNPGVSGSPNDLQLIYNSLVWSSLISYQTTQSSISTGEIQTIVVILAAIIGGISLAIFLRKKIVNRKINKIAIKSQDEIIEEPKGKPEITDEIQEIVEEYIPVIEEKPIDVKEVIDLGELVTQDPSQIDFIGSFSILLLGGLALLTTKDELNQFIIIFSFIIGSFLIFLFMKRTLALSLNIRSPIADSLLVLSIIVILSFLLSFYLNLQNISHFIIADLLTNSTLVFSIILLLLGITVRLFLLETVLSKIGDEIAQVYNRIKIWVSRSRLNMIRSLIILAIFSMYILKNTIPVYLFQIVPSLLILLFLLNATQKWNPGNIRSIFRLMLAIIGSMILFDFYNIYYSFNNFHVIFKFPLGFSVMIWAISFPRLILQGSYIWKVIVSYFNSMKNWIIKTANWIRAHKILLIRWFLAVVGLSLILLREFMSFTINLVITLQPHHLGLILLGISVSPIIYSWLKEIVMWLYNTTKALLYWLLSQLVSVLKWLKMTTLAMLTWISLNRLLSTRIFSTGLGTTFIFLDIYNFKPFIQLGELYFSIAMGFYLFAAHPVLIRWSRRLFTWVLSLFYDIFNGLVNFSKDLYYSFEWFVLSIYDWINQNRLFSSRILSTVIATSFLFIELKQELLGYELNQIISIIFYILAMLPTLIKWIEWSIPILKKNLYNLYNLINFIYLIIIVILTYIKSNTIALYHWIKEHKLSSVRILSIVIATSFSFIELEQEVVGYRLDLIISAVFYFLAFLPTLINWVQIVIRSLSSIIIGIYNYFKSKISGFLLTIKLIIIVTYQWIGSNKLLSLRIFSFIAGLRLYIFSIYLPDGFYDVIGIAFMILSLLPSILKWLRIQIQKIIKVVVNAFLALFTYINAWDKISGWLGIILLVTSVFSSSYRTPLLIIGGILVSVGWNATFLHWIHTQIKGIIKILVEIGKSIWIYIKSITVGNLLSTVALSMMIVAFFPSVFQGNFALHASSFIIGLIVWNISYDYRRLRVKKFLLQIYLRIYDGISGFFMAIWNGISHGWQILYHNIFLIVFFASGIGFIIISISLILKESRVTILFGLFGDDLVRIFVGISLMGIGLLAIQQTYARREALRINDKEEVSIK